VLATYSIPLGSNEVTITFTGKELSVYDFDALADYVTIFRKQFERKSAAEKMLDEQKRLDDQKVIDSFKAP
jgi:hypothetical protein